MHHAGQRLSILGDGRHIEIAADVRSTMTDEHANARRLPSDVPLRWIDHLLRARPPGRRDHSPGDGGRSAGLDYRFGDVLRLAERPHGEDPRSARLQRGERLRTTEPVFIQSHVQSSPQLACPFRYLHPYREHNQIKLLFDYLPIPFRDVPQDQVVGFRVLHHHRDPRAHVADPIPFLGAVIILQVALAEGTHVHHKDRHLSLWLVLDGHNRFLSGIHTTNRRTIIVFLIAGSDTLEKSDFLWRLTIGEPLDMAVSWAGGTQQPLELNRRDDIGEAAPPVLRRMFGVEDLITGGHNDSPHLQLHHLLHHIVVNRIGLTDIPATQTLRADAAGQTTGGLGLGQLVGIPHLDLGEIGDPFFHRQLRHRHTGSHLHLPPRDPLLNLRPAQVHHRQLRLQGRLQLVSPQVAMDGLGHPMAGGHRLYDKGRAGGSVTGREDPRSSRGQRVGIDGNRLLAGDPDTGAFRDERQPGPLPDGKDNHITRDDVFRPGLRLQRKTAIGGKLHKRHIEAFHPCHPPIAIGYNPLEGTAGVEMNALRLTSLDLPGMGRHRFTALQTGHPHLGGPQADGRAGHVHGHVAAPQHQHALTGHSRRLSQAHIPQELGVDQHSLQVHPLDGQQTALVGTDGNQYRFESLGEDIVQIVHPRVEPQLHPQVHNVLYLAVHDLRRETIFRHTHPQHPAGDRQGLKDGDAIPLFTQVLRRRQPTGTGADHRHPFRIDPLRRFRRRPGLGIHLVGHEPLEGVDVDRIVQFAPVAGILAAVVTDTSTDGREWVVLLDYPQGVLVPSLADQSDVPLHPLSGRTGIPTRGDAPLLDSKSVGHRLRIQLVGGPLDGQPLIKATGDDHRADLGTITAAGALIHINVARMDPYPHREIARFPSDSEHLAIRQQLDVPMTATVHQLGADDAHSAVISRKGLIQLGHVATDGRFLLHQIDLVTGLGQIQGGLDASNAPTDDHHRTDHSFIHHKIVAHSHPPIVPSSGSASVLRR